MTVGHADSRPGLAGHLMQRAERQSAFRQMPVDRLDAEGQHGSPARGRALETLDARAKLFDTGMGNGRIHGLGNGLGWLYVPYLFSYPRRVNWSLTGEGQED